MNAARFLIPPVIWVIHLFHFAGTWPTRRNNGPEDRANRMNSVGPVESHAEGELSVRAPFASETNPEIVQREFFSERSQRVNYPKMIWTIASHWSLPQKFATTSDRCLRILRSTKQCDRILACGSFGLTNGSVQCDTTPPRSPGRSVADRHIGGVPTWIEAVKAGRLTTACR
jgi:hypothetical protein